jgi:hypothetical protein
MEPDQQVVEKAVFSQAGQKHPDASIPFYCQHLQQLLQPVVGNK